MKKNFLALSAVVIALMLSAFSLRPVDHTDGQTTRWGKTDASGALLLDPDYFEGNVDQARTRYGCPSDGTNYCAKEVDVNGDILIPGASIKRN